MTIKLTKSLMIALMFLFSTSSIAQDEAPKMTYEMAQKAMVAAEAYARDKEWNVTIMVTDQFGTPVMLHRIDGASARTFDIVRSKALVVLQTGLTSGQYGTMLAAGEIEEIEGGVTFQGGVPVYVDGELVGAVTASGVRGNQDEEVSMAGAAMIGSITKD
jgi:glc operon protein GlcG